MRAELNKIKRSAVKYFYFAKQLVCEQDRWVPTERHLRENELITLPLLVLMLKRLIVGQIKARHKPDIPALCSIIPHIFDYLHFQYLRKNSWPQTYRYVNRRERRVAKSTLFASNRIIMLTRSNREISRNFNDQPFSLKIGHPIAPSHII